MRARRCGSTRSSRAFAATAGKGHVVALPRAVRSAVGVLVPGIDALDLPVVGLDALDGRAGAHHAVLDPLARDHPVVRIEGIGYLVLARAAGDAALQARDTSMPALALLELQGVTSSRDTDSLAADHLTRNPQ